MKYKWFRVFFEADGAGGGGGDSAGAGNNPADNSLGDNSDGDMGAGNDKPNIFDKHLDNQPAGEEQQKPEESVIPEEYEFKLGEGLSISDELKARFTKVAKEAKLTQAQANALLDMHSETMLELIKAGEDQAAEWEAECGKQGLLAKEKLGYAVEALNVFGGDEAKRVLIETGAVNHPAVMTMLQTIGELIHEDTNKEGASNPPVKEDLGAILFSNSKYD